MKPVFDNIRIAVAVIPRELRGRIKYLVMGATIGLFLELLGLSFIIPAIQMLVNPSSLANFPLINDLVDTSTANVNPMFASIGLLILVVLYFIKSLFMTYLLKYQTKFAYDVQNIIGIKLFHNYLRCINTEGSVNSTSTQIRNIITEIPIFVTNVLIYGLQLFSELIPLVATISFLLYVDFQGTLVTAVVSLIIGYTYYKITRQHVKNLGESRQQSEELRFRELNHSLMSKKEILIYDLFSLSENRFTEVNSRLSNISRSQSVIQQIPRYWFEFISIFAIILLAYHLTLSGRSEEELLITIGVFAFGAFKLLPSINRILLSIQAINYGLPSSQLLHNELTREYRGIDNLTGNKIDFFEKLEVRSLSYTYSQASEEIISELNFTIEKGQWIAIVGKSGSGKSTLLDLLLGLRHPTSGQIYLNGHPLNKICLSSFYSLIGYVPQDVFIYEDTLQNNLTYWRSDIDSSKLTHAVNISKLSDFVRTIKLGYDTPISERGFNISGGQRQRVAIARAIYRGPQIYILDEATGSLDKETELSLLLSLKRECQLSGLTLISITHSTECLDLFDQVIDLSPKC